MSAVNDPALRRLVGGVLWPGYLGREVPDWLRRELGDGGLAGAVLFSHNVPSAGTFRDLAPNLLIGIDEEGGNVSRLEARTGSTLPGAAQLGFVDDPDATTAVARELAARSLAVGANVVLAPVADVNTDPGNPVIGVRAFGSTPELVSRHVAAAVRGIQSAGAAACVKHFPGHGDTHLDSHVALPYLDLDPEEIERMHLPPFRAAIDAGAAAVMTGHLVVPAWGEAPATLNPAVLGRLRAMGFDGVIVSDALDMAAVRDTVGAGPGAVRALLAGADLLCVGNPRNPGAAAMPDQDERDFREVQGAILAAIDDGALPVAVLERAAARVGALGAALAGGGTAGERGRATDASRAALDAASVARAAITVDAWFPPMPAPRTVLDARGRATIAVDGDADYVADALAGGGEVVRLDVGGVAGAGADAGEAAGASLRSAVAAAAQREEPLVVLVDRVGSSQGAQRDVIEQLAAIRPGAVVVDVGWPGGPLPLAALHTRAASRLAAETASAVLAAGGRLEASA
ncbi:glycoside hydrolase family 3 N-terminal domain-containing protein [Agromyces sp. H66]|uniref:glycoside hydrolase family 3 N-terminal domain-containing protein n=1 Tax=Agromyces sp. H66 TaxID=2529859 RepID=UPI0010AA2639|nr:glycoside hydrolase family 3 N-terminal domain-containing protein [Agromyces sp. H66]